MAFTDLQAFLRALEAEGELKRVTVPVDPELEITEIATRALGRGGPALLFENVRGSSYPLAINSLASMRRIELALGMHPEALGEQIVQFVERMNPPSLKALWRNRKAAWRFMAFRPGGARRPMVQEVVEESPDLGRLPILKCWPDDGGRFITLPLVMSKDPETGVGNMGIYRMHVYDADTTGMHMQIQKGGGFHHFKAEQRSEPLEMAVVLGGDPALLLAAVMPLPEGLDEVAFSGLIRGKRTPMTQSRTLQMRVPAHAEFILEGTVPPGRRRMEGPFGDHFGHYSEKAQFPIFELRTITRRRNPIYPATVVGKPPQEDRYLGDAAQMALKPLGRLIHREIKDMWAYYEAGFHNLLVVSVEGRYTREPIKTALGLLGEGQLSLTKTLILVGPDVNPQDPTAVLRAIRRNFKSEEDFLLIGRAPIDTLDFTGEAMHHGSKMIMDATENGPPESSAVALPADLGRIFPNMLRWRLLGRALLAVQVAGNGKEAVKTLASSPLLGSLKIIAVVSEDVDITNDVELLWGIFTRFDPARDVVFSEVELRGSLPIYKGVMGIDATHKKGYPAPLTMAPEIIKKVDTRWFEYWK